MQLSNNFYLNELLVSESAARKGFAEQYTPPPDVVDNLQTLCNNVLQPLRDKIGKPIIVTSGYRCKRVNYAAGGAPSSQHLLGQAADINVGGMGVEELFKFIINSGIEYDQVIQEFDAWVHISYSKGANRLQKLRANKGSFGRTIYLPS